MTKTKRIRHRILAQEHVIRDHERKITHERQKQNPDRGLIAHWELEIQAAHQKVARLQRHLAALRRRS